MRKMTRSREHHVRPGTDEMMVNIRLRIPRSAAGQMKELEHLHSCTKEQIFLAGIRSCMEHRD